MTDKISVSRKIQKILRTICRKVRTICLDLNGTLLRQTSKRIIQAKGPRIPEYHGICGNQPCRFNSRYLSFTPFEDHLKILNTLYHPVSLKNVVSGNLPVDKLNALLTFDAGLKNNFAHTFPLLKQHYFAAPVTNILLQEGHDGVINDEAYKTYKCYNSNTVIGIKEQRFWVNLPKGGWIGALATLHKELFSQTLRNLEHLTKAVSITFMISPGTSLDTALPKTQQADKGFAVIIKNLSRKYEASRLKFQFSDLNLF
jgi:hypothetical protein